MAAAVAVAPRRAGRRVAPPPVVYPPFNPLSSSLQFYFDDPVVSSLKDPLVRVANDNHNKINVHSYAAEVRRIVLLHSLEKIFSSPTRNPLIFYDFYGSVRTYRLVVRLCMKYNKTAVVVLAYGMFSDKDGSRYHVSVFRDIAERPDPRVRFYPVEVTLGPVNDQVEYVLNRHRFRNIQERYLLLGDVYEVFDARRNVVPISPRIINYLRTSLNCQRAIWNGFQFTAGQDFLTFGDCMAMFRENNVIFFPSHRDSDNYYEHHVPNPDMYTHFSTRFNYGAYTSLTFSDEDAIYDPVSVAGYHNFNQIPGLDEAYDRAAPSVHSLHVTNAFEMTIQGLLTSNIFARYQVFAHCKLNVYATHFRSKARDYVNQRYTDRTMDKVNDTNTVLWYQKFFNIFQNNLPAANNSRIQVILEFLTAHVNKAALLGTAIVALISASIAIPLTIAKSASVGVKGGAIISTLLASAPGVSSGFIIAEACLIDPLLEETFRTLLIDAMLPYFGPQIASLVTYILYVLLEVLSSMMNPLNIPAKVFLQSVCSYLAYLETVSSGNKSTTHIKAFRYVFHSLYNVISFLPTPAFLISAVVLCLLSILFFKMMNSMKTGGILYNIFLKSLSVIKKYNSTMYDIMTEVFVKWNSYADHSVDPTESLLCHFIQFSTNTSNAILRWLHEFASYLKPSPPKTVTISVSSLYFDDITNEIGVREARNESIIFVPKTSLSTSLFRKLTGAQFGEPIELLDAYMYPGTKPLEQWFKDKDIECIMVNPKCDSIHVKKIESNSIIDPFPHDFDYSGEEMRPLHVNDPNPFGKKMCKKKENVQVNEHFDDVELKEEELHLQKREKKEEICDDEIELIESFREEDKEEENNEQKIKKEEIIEEKDSKYHLKVQNACLNWLFSFNEEDDSKLSNTIRAKKCFNRAKKAIENLVIPQVSNYIKQEQYDWCEEENPLAILETEIEPLPVEKIPKQTPEWYLERSIPSFKQARTKALEIVDTRLAQVSSVYANYVSKAKSVDFSSFFQETRVTCYPTPIPFVGLRPTDSIDFDPTFILQLYKDCNYDPHWQYELFGFRMPVTLCNILIDRFNRNNMWVEQEAWIANRLLHKGKFGIETHSVGGYFTNPKCSIYLKDFYLCIRVLSPSPFSKIKYQVLANFYQIHKTLPPISHILTLFNHPQSPLTIMNKEMKTLRKRMVSASKRILDCIKYIPTQHEKDVFPTLFSLLEYFNDKNFPSNTKFLYKQALEAAMEMTSPEAPTTTLMEINQICKYTHATTLLLKENETLLKELSPYTKSITHTTPEDYIHIIRPEIPRAVFAVDKDPVAELTPFALAIKAAFKYAHDNEENVLEFSVGKKAIHTVFNIASGLTLEDISEITQEAKEYSAIYLSGAKAKNTTMPYYDHIMTSGDDATFMVWRKGVFIGGIGPDVSKFDASQDYSIIKLQLKFMARLTSKIYGYSESSLARLLMYCFTRPLKFNEIAGEETPFMKRVMRLSGAADTSMSNSLIMLLILLLVKELVCERTQAMGYFVDINTNQKVGGLFDPHAYLKSIKSGMEYISTTIFKLTNLEIKDSLEKMTFLRCYFTTLQDKIQMISSTGLILKAMSKIQEPYKFNINIMNLNQIQSFRKTVLSSLLALPHHETIDQLAVFFAEVPECDEETSGKIKTYLENKFKEKFSITWGSVSKTVDFSNIWEKRYSMEAVEYMRVIEDLKLPCVKSLTFAKDSHKILTVDYT